MDASFTFPERSRTESIRPFEADDLPAVARLFQRNFRERRRAPPLALRTYLGELFLEHPWRDPELTSQVHLSRDGAVNGFIGVLPLMMDFRGRKIRAAVAGTLMVDQPDHNPLAGAKLLRSFIAGPQDLSFSESANAVSHRMWTALGGRPVLLSGMEWLRVLRPAGTGVNLLVGSSLLARPLHMLAAAADSLVEKMKRNTFRLTEAKQPAEARDIEIGEDGFIEHTLNFASAFALRPDWNAERLRFILMHAAKKERHGTLFRRLVYAGGDTPIGAYLYYVRPGGVAWVLQVLAASGRANLVLGSLLKHAEGQGAVAVRGRTDATLMDALLLHRCIFTHRSSVMVHARDPELRAAAHSAEALLTGMAAESWTRIIGGIFR